MSLKMEKVPGSHDPGKGVSVFNDTSRRPVLTCDTKGCNGRFEGNAGSDEASVKERAYSMGWRRDPGTSKDSCPDCANDHDADDKGAKK